MAIPRKIVAQDDTQEAQWLKIDHSSRYIENHSEEWQFLFGPNSELSSSNQIVKIAAKFDEQSFNNIKVTAYLFDQQNGTVGNSSICTFKIYSITGANWTETLLTTIPGAQLPNFYFYINPTITSLGTIDFQGGDSIMIEATVTRLSTVYRDRIYVNHLGIYDNVTRLRGDVEFLEVTKKDE